MYNRLLKGLEMENWVQLRHDCSAFEMFTKLRTGVEEDVNIRNGLRKLGEQVAFRVDANDSSFTVRREGPLGVCASVKFAWTPKEISVRPYSKTSLATYTADSLSVILTLTDEGECKLRLPKGEELTCWQFRKRVLEDLFFNF